MLRIASEEQFYLLVKPINPDIQVQYENHTPIHHDPYSHPAPNSRKATISVEREVAGNQRFQPSFYSQQTLAYIRFYMKHLAPGAGSLLAGQYSIEDQGQLFSFTLDADMTYFDSMNLEALIANRQSLMNCLLRVENKDRYFPSGSHLIAVRDACGGIVKLCFFTTTLDIAVRQDKYGHMVCDVINVAMKGHGWYGSVYEIAGSFKHRYFHPVGFHFEPGEGRRLVKVVCEEDSFARTFNYRADHEAMMMKRFRHFQSRNTFFGMTGDDKRVYALSMRKFGGCDLQVLLEADLKQDPLNDADRFEIAIELLQAVNSQIFDCCGIHNDLKPDNIRVWKDQTGWHVAILDAGISTLIGVEDNLNIFVPTYAPREAVGGGRTVASDIFSIGLVIAMLFRDMQQRKIISMVQKDLIRKLRERNNWEICFDMFANMPNFPDECKSMIQALLCRMTHPIITNRPNIYECIIEVKSIYRNYLTLVNGLDAKVDEHVDNEGKLMSEEPYDALYERFRGDLKKSWQLIKRYNALYDKYAIDDRQDRSVLNDLRSYAAELKDFTARRYVKIAPEHLFAEATHVRRKLEKMTRSFECFKSKLDNVSVSQNISPRI